MKCGLRTSSLFTNMVRTEPQTEHRQLAPCRRQPHVRRQNQMQRQTVRQPPPLSHCRVHWPSRRRGWRDRRLRQGRRRRTQRYSFVVWQVWKEAEEWRNGSLEAGSLGRRRDIYMGWDGQWVALRNDTARVLACWWMLSHNLLNSLDSRACFETWVLLYVSNREGGICYRSSTSNQIVDQSQKWCTTLGMF